LIRYPYLNINRYLHNHPLVARRGRQAKEEREELGRRDMHHETEGGRERGRAIIRPKELD
jgi:hypothetical protein